MALYPILPSSAEVTLQVISYLIAISASTQGFNTIDGELDQLLVYIQDVMTERGVRHDAISRKAYIE